MRKIILSSIVGLVLASFVYAQPIGLSKLMDRGISKGQLQTEMKRINGKYNKEVIKIEESKYILEKIEAENGGKIDVKAIKMILNRGDFLRYAVIEIINQKDAYAEALSLQKDSSQLKDLYIKNLEKRLADCESRKSEVRK